MITQCTIQHLYKTKNEAAIDLAKTFERRRCGHLPLKKHQKVEEQSLNASEEEGKKKKPENKGTLSAFECMTEVVSIKGQNKHRYVVATQKPKLRMAFRKIPAVPLIYINRAVMIMEPMSPVTEKARDKIELEKLTKGLNDPNASRKHPLQEENTDDIEQPVVKKRKGPKEPNPLSIKKKTTKSPATNIVEKSGDEDATEGASSGRKRRRKHKRSHNESTKESDQADKRDQRPSSDEVELNGSENENN